MHERSHHGSIRVVAALRRYTRENTALLAVTNDLDTYGASITVVQRIVVVEEGEKAPEPVSLSAVLAGCTGLRLRSGGKYLSIKEAKASLGILRAQEFRHEDTMEDCLGTLIGLLGTAGAKRAVREACRG